jgi:protein subunit release factor B
MFESLLLLGFLVAGISQMFPEEKQTEKNERNNIRTELAWGKPTRESKQNKFHKQKNRKGRKSMQPHRNQNKRIKGLKIQEAG